MISAHYMREMQRDNERRIERANEIRRYYYQDGETLPAEPGIISRILNNIGSTLVNIGTRMQSLSAYPQVES
jgi:hypothetical protein